MIKKSIGVVSPISVGVEPSDLGSAAYKDTGTGSGQIPILDSNGKLVSGVIPSIAITDVFTASSEQDMLALSAEKGDVCVRSDVNKTYLLMDDPASTLSNWVEISSANYVTSVNNKTGAVTLNASDVGAVSTNSAITGNTKCKITYDSKGLVTSGADLSSSDIPDLSSTYVATNNAIIGDTKCKITYDSKGLVTAGADLQASDIPDLSSTYITKNAAITGATKCKITYDSDGLVTSGADLSSSDIPDISSSYVATNTAITGDTKCKITYDSKGLVTAGADLQASDIPDLSSSYVATNTAITSATKCKITYDSKGLVTAGDDLAAADLPSHTHSFSDISSGTVPLANGGTGATTNINAFTNLGMIDTQGQDFSANSEADYINAVQNFFETNSTEYVPYIFNAGWQGQGYGVACGIQSLKSGSYFNDTLFIFNEKAGTRIFHKDKDSNGWVDYSPTGVVLYENSSGTQSTVVLSNSAAKFKRIKIYYKHNDGERFCMDVNDPDGQATLLFSVKYKDANYSYLSSSQIFISGTSITWGTYTGYNRLATTPAITRNDGKYISILKVVGFKR